MRHLERLLFIPLLALVACGGSEEATEEETVEMDTTEVAVDTIPDLPITSVEDCRENPCADFDLSTKVTGDVAVRREAGDWGEGYRCFYFHDLTDSLKAYAGILVTEDDYDQATYEWIDDTTITFVLQNSETDAEYIMQLFGNGSVNGMVIPDAEDENEDELE